MKTAAEVIYRADSEKDLTKDELSAMARVVNAYLDLAELRAEEQISMTMEDWAEQHALSEFEKYRVRQDQLYQSDFDCVLLEIEEEGNETEEHVLKRYGYYDEKGTILITKSSSSFYMIYIQWIVLIHPEH